MNSRILMRGLVASLVAVIFVWADAGPLWGADYQWARSIGGGLSPPASFPFWYLAADPSGNVWASGGPGLWKFDNTGSLLLHSHDAVAGGMAVDPSGNVWVANYPGRSIQGVSGDLIVPEAAEYGRDGTLLSTFSTIGNVSFPWPELVAVDPTGNVYLGDSRTPSIFKYSSTGDYIATISPPSFIGLAGIAADPTGNLWVGNCAAT